MNSLKPSKMYLSISWFAFAFANVVFGIGLYNAELLLSEKGFYFAVLILGLFSVITVQKSIRDRIDGIEVSGMFFNLGYFAVAVSIFLMTIGLFNATISFNEKGFFAVTYIMSLFSSIVMQKNVRDLSYFEDKDKDDERINIE